ncbi:MAG: ROK family protein [Ktedonobacterales bacterium]
MPARHAIGVDIGGTKIYAGIIDLETGKAIATARKPTRPDKGVTFFVQRLGDVIEEALVQGKTSRSSLVPAIGIGLAGQVDRERGIVLGAPNLATGLVNLDLSTLLEHRFSLPVVLGNDVEVAAYGEQMFGSGRGCADFVYISVGTGIGGAIVRNGEICRGATGTAGEIGHTVVQYDGRFCGCGGRGHLEAYASRTAITRVIQAEMERGRPSKLSDLLRVDAPEIRSKMLAKCVEEKDELVLEAMNEGADYLGAGIGSVVSFANPERIILGGGLIEAVPQFFERAVMRSREVALAIPGRQADITHTELGDDSGIVGAACMAGSKYQRDGTAENGP